MVSFQDNFNRAKVPVGQRFFFSAKFADRHGYIAARVSGAGGSGHPNYNARTRKKTPHEKTRCGRVQGRVFPAFSVRYIRLLQGTGFVIFGVILPGLGEAKPQLQLRCKPIGVAKKKPKKNEKTHSSNSVCATEHGYFL